MLEDSFLEYLKSERNRSERTVSNYRLALREFKDFFNSLGEGWAWKSITPEIVREWVIFMFLPLPYINRGGECESHGESRGS